MFRPRLRCSVFYAADRTADHWVIPGSRLFNTHLSDARGIANLRDSCTRAKAAPLQALAPSPTSLIPGVVGVDGVNVSFYRQVMLDIRLLREKPDFVRERLATRGGDLSSQVDAILAQDAEGAEQRPSCRNAMRNETG